jgi:hypothetical protein
LVLSPFDLELDLLEELLLSESVLFYRHFGHKFDRALLVYHLAVEGVLPVDISWQLSRVPRVIHIEHMFHELTLEFNDSKRLADHCGVSLGPRLLLILSLLNQT